MGDRGNPRSTAPSQPQPRAVFPPPPPPPPVPQMLAQQHRMQAFLAHVSQARRPPPPPRACVVCCDKDDVHLVKACRLCDADYCRSCLQEMFEAALKDPTRMPPRCCTFMQIYVVPGLADSDRALYRAKFEEWLTLDKVYCPSARCSAFIPPRHIPQPNRSLTQSDSLNSEAPPSLQDVLSGLVRKISSSECARFFRGDLDATMLPGYSEIVATHMDLRCIKSKVEKGQYASLADLSKDVTLLVSNARLYNGSDHPVTKVADELMAFYVQQLSRTAEVALQAPPPVEGLAASTKANVQQKQASVFPCPSCHIAICTYCKQMEHGASECDTSSKNHEQAMLESFGYKRCPRCGHGVRRMFGCSHMQCYCGAHWCWHCTKSIDECLGDCGDAGYSDEEESEDDDDSEMVNNDGQAPTQNSTQDHASQAVPLPENLDGGGARRWVEAGLDFGDEPSEEAAAQVWSCHHYWRKFETPKVEFDRGDLSLLECNRCFKRLKPPSPTTGQAKKPRRLSKQPQGEDEAHEAWECASCRLIVCLSCKDIYGEMDEDL